MGDIESILREVDSSMAMEGMPLRNDDKNRIRRCLTNLDDLEKEISALIEKHTASTRLRKTV